MRPLRNPASLALVWMLAAACVAPPRSAAEDYSGGRGSRPFSRFAAGVGYRGMDSSWEPFDDQLAFQFGGQHEWPSFPLGVEYALGFSGDDREIGNVWVTNSTLDLSVGPVHTFPLDEARRFFASLGGGALIAFTEEDAPCFVCDSEDDEWFAGYLHASIFWRAGWNFDFGFDVRWTKGEDLELGNDTLDGESLQVLLVSGFAW